MAATMHIRRVGDEAELLASLEEDAPTVLPLCFRDAEREWIGRTVAPQLAALAPGDEVAFAGSSVTAGSDDVVLGTPAAPVSLLAKRYAELTGRRLVLAEPQGVAAALAHERLRSVTWFPTLERTDMGAMYDVLYGAFTSGLGAMPRLGVLTGESLARLTWLLAKQLVPRTEPSPAITMVSYEASGMEPPPSVTRLTPAHARTELLASFEQVRGTLLIVGHSRSYCGLMPTADGLVGLCGLASGGAGGRCADGSPCSFGETHRTVLQDLGAERVFFNSCSTAIVDSPRLPYHLPRSAMVGHAVLRSRAREYIGNVRIGIFGEIDLNWLIGASALGYTPAECIPIIEASRRLSGREELPSALYFGDATNPAWPVEDVCIGTAAVESEALARLRWSRSDTILVARVPGGSWAQLAAHDRLEVGTPGQQPRHEVAIVPDPWSDASLVLAVPRTATTGANDEAQPLELALSVLPEPIDRSVGNILTSALEHLRWLQSLPTFKASLADRIAELEGELVKMRGFAASRGDVTMVPARLQHIRAVELEIVRYIDDLLIDRMLHPADAPFDWTKEPFDWTKEHAWRMRSVPVTRAPTCPTCGAHMFEVHRTDYVSPSIKRIQTGCSHCGQSDLPACDLHLKILPETTVSPTTVTGTAQIFNGGDRARDVTLGAVLLETYGRLLPSSVTKQKLSLGPSATYSFDFSLETRERTSKRHRVRIYLASEGAFGMVHQILTFLDDHDG